MEKKVERDLDSERGCHGQARKERLDGVRPRQFLLHSGIEFRAGTLGLYRTLRAGNGRLMRPSNNEYLCLRICSPRNFMFDGKCSPGVCRSGLLGRGAACRCVLPCKEM